MGPWPASQRRLSDAPFLSLFGGLDSEVGFWHALLDPENEGHPDVDQVAWKSARHWLQSGDVQWHYGDICSFLELREAGYGAARVLNAGSGPLAPGHIECGQRVPVVASDGLARFYLQLFVALAVHRLQMHGKDLLEQEPPAFPVQCPTESLHDCFPQDHFDVVQMRSPVSEGLWEMGRVWLWRNSLDHANDPLMGILELIWVVRLEPLHVLIAQRPGGYVLLRHARNEGVAGHFQLGLHQWAFDVEEATDGDHFVPLGG